MGRSYGSGRACLGIIPGTMKTIRDEQTNEDSPKADGYGGDDPECAGTLLPFG